MVFSNDGQYIVLGTATGTHYVLNAYDLSILRRLDSQQPGLGRLSGEEVCWTADSKWVLSGCPDGAVAAWDLTPPDGTIPQTSTTRAESAPTLQPTALLRPGGDGLHAVSRAVRFNPRYGLLAVGGEELVSTWPCCCVVLTTLLGPMAAGAIRRRGGGELGIYIYIGCTRFRYCFDYHMCERQ